MDGNIRSFLSEIAKEEGFEPTDDVLIEILTEAKVIWEGDHDERRHWTDVWRVAQIKDKFLKYAWATGGDIYDSGWEFDPETIQEVVPKEITTTIYVALESNNLG